MQEFVFKIVKQIVDHPEEVQVLEVQNELGKNLNLKVFPSDMGKVIGKSGKIIKALRDLVRIKAIKSGEKGSLQLVEP